LSNNNTPKVVLVLDPSIGKNLIGLSLKLSKMDIDTIRMIVKFCPNLEYLALGFRFYQVSEEVKNEIKDGLKRLSKFRINGDCVRLGTDWVGY
jgi:hypothetical protein